MRLGESVFLISTIFIILGNVFIYFVSLIVNDPAIFGITIPHSTLSILALVSVIILAGIIYYDRYVVKAKHKKALENQVAEGDEKLARTIQELESKDKELSEAYIQMFLIDIIERLKVPDARAFVYLSNPETEELKVEFEYGMTTSPDRDLRFKPSSGWAGIVWHRAGQEKYTKQKKRQYPSQITFDLSIYDSASLQGELITNWGFTFEQCIKIQEACVQSVLYIPIRNPEKGTKKVVLGVLGIDSKKPISETPFEDHNTQDEVAWLAQITLGANLKGGKWV